MGTNEIWIAGFQEGKDLSYHIDDSMEDHMVTFMSAKINADNLLGSNYMSGGVLSGVVWRGREYVVFAVFFSKEPMDIEHHADVVSSILDENYPYWDILGDGE